MDDVPGSGGGSVSVRAGILARCDGDLDRALDEAVRLLEGMAANLDLALEAARWLSSRGYYRRFTIPDGRAEPDDGAL